MGIRPIEPETVVPSAVNKEDDFGYRFYLWAGWFAYSLEDPVYHDYDLSDPEHEAETYRSYDFEEWPDPEWRYWAPRADTWRVVGTGPE